MALSLQERFERSCRLCAEEQEVTIMIFSVEAEAMLLQNKLNKYLLIEIDEEDKLPKNICIQCCTKLQTCCDFIDTACKAQDILMKRSILIDQMSTMPLEEHLQVKTEPVELDESYPQEEGMEVSVDPMDVLQNSEDDLLPKNEDITGLEDESEVFYLNGLDGENVTIKLIKKGDQSPDEDNDDPTKKSDSLIKPFPCLVCKRSFLTDLALKNHSWIHSKDDNKTKAYECNICKESFDLRNSLISHVKEHRTCNTCTVCGRVFRSLHNLNLHMESHRTPHNPHVCKICGRAYNNSSNLRTHSITHSNERPFKCHLCKKSFKRNQDLKFHINQHTGEKPYKCPFCEKSFASSGNCYSHRSRMHPGKSMEGKSIRGRKRMITVAQENQLQLKAIGPKSPLVNVKGVYKYQCQLCDHSFVKRDNYAYHMFQHTGEKPMQCSFCTEKFFTRKGLLLHHDKEHAALGRPLGLLSKNAFLK